ncbi:epididymal-specific lipocalin-12 isoform X3 [Ovis aries]|uniref:epididymal-specific lipocalin-12 isoform X3 n=1 Tax=Ovis aries TaxID=9940 RepID=UPI0005FC2923|nr:epididymal-specific lipocalin-12 isoform X3 [Ovis aries]
MGLWVALWVLLYLPRALQGQNPHSRAAPTSVLHSFEDSKFQGEWFVLGLAGNTHTVADRSLLSPFTATFTLNKNNRLEVAYAMFRGQRCITWSYELISQSQPGVFSVDHSGGRIWAIQTQLLDKFVCLVRAQGLSDDNIIFPDLTDWPVLPDNC